VFSSEASIFWSEASMEPPLEGVEHDPNYTKSPPLRSSKWR
jgi:hypothetical protein